MLITFRFKNFTSYKEEAYFNMTAIKSFKELASTNIISTTRDFSLLKTAAIYGSNGGGKSNFMKAIAFMGQLMRLSYSESLKKEEERGRTDYYFKLSSQSEVQPTLFEVTFLSDNIIYRYGFEVKGFDILSEWFYKKNGKEVCLFKRQGTDFSIHKTEFADGTKYKNNVNSNVLLASYLAQNNSKDIQPLLHFFMNINVIDGLDDAFYKKVTKTLYKELPEFKIWLSYALRFLEISQIGISKEDHLLVFHNKYDENSFIIDSVPFALEEESDGTQKLIYLLGAVYDTLLNSRVLFIDELDSKLHPNLSWKLLQLFQEFNRKEAQFVFTAHDANLLDKDILRRDQIWFVDRDQFGASHLYSLSDFDVKVVRNSSDFRKKYLASTFGAAESMDITSNMIDLMYGKEE